MSLYLKIKIILSKILLLIVILTIFIILSEIVLRIIGEESVIFLRKEKPLPFNLTELAIKSNISGLNFELRPNLFVKEGNVSYITNSEGFRDREFSYQKDNNTFRIAIVGDSYTFGIGVNMENTYPKKLELLLNNKSTDKKFEVYNFGIPAYNMLQERIILEKKVVKFKPDLVIYQFFLDDFGEEGMIISGIAEARYLPKVFSHFLARTPKINLEKIDYNKVVPISLPLPYSLNKFLLHNSYFFRFISLRGLQIKYLFEPYNETYMRERYLQGKIILQEMKKITQTLNISFFLLIVPHTFEPGETDEVILNRYAYKWIHEIADELEIKKLDLYYVFKNHSSSDITLESKRWNEMGHMLVANAIYKFLLKENAIPT